MSISKKQKDLQSQMSLKKFSTNSYLQKESPKIYVSKKINKNEGLQVPLFVTFLGFLCVLYFKSTF